MGKQVKIYSGQSFPHHPVENEEIGDLQNLEDSKTRSLDQQENFTHHRKELDNSHVKRPLNSFMVFSSEHRRSIAASNPSMAHCEISKMCSERWRSMTEEEKKPFIDKATQLKELHKEQFPDYVFKPCRKKVNRSKFYQGYFSQLPYLEKQFINVNNFVGTNNHSNNSIRDNCDIDNFHLRQQSEIKDEIFSEASEEIESFNATPAFFSNQQLFMKNSDLDDKAQERSHVKRPLNSFMVFSSEHRRSIAAKNPSMAHCEISKMCSERWRSMTEEEKKPFIDKATQLKELHKEQFPDYVFKPCRKRLFEHQLYSKGALEGRSSERQQSGFDSRTPVDGVHLNGGNLNEHNCTDLLIVNAFTVFVCEKVKNNLEQLGGRRLKELCSLKWSRMGDEEKRSYVRTAETINNVIVCEEEESQEAFKQEVIGCGSIESVDHTPVHKEVLCDKAQERSHVKRPLNSFMVFSSEHRRSIAASNPSMAHCEISKMCSEKWRSMTEEKKKPFIDKATQLKELHKEQFPDYVFKPCRKRCSLKRQVTSRLHTSDFLKY